MKTVLPGISLASLILTEGILARALLPAQPLYAGISLIPFTVGIVSLLLLVRKRDVTVEQDMNEQKVPEAEMPVCNHDQWNEPQLQSQEEETTSVSLSEDMKDFIRVYDSALPELFKSIIVYLNKTSEPMSETLLNLKTGITTFLSTIQKTREEFESTSKLEEVHKGVSLLRNHITEITTENNRSCIRFASDIDTLSVQMSSITEFLSSISDIAARVHVLSINASIEAARSGQHGRGFKVIANEIQKLAKETQTFVTTIGDTLEKTNTVFGALKTSMKENQQVIERQSSENSSTYEDISHLLENRLGDIKTMYQQVVEYVETVDIDITTLSPITMLHAIITQEIENLEKLWTDFTDSVQTAANNKDTGTENYTDTIAIEKIRSRLTTARELSALEKSLKELGLDSSSSIRKTETDIEFF